MDGSTSTSYYCFKSRLCSDFKLKSLVGNKDALSQISSFYFRSALHYTYCVKQLHIDTQENNKINGLVMEICIKPMWWKKKVYFVLVFLNRLLTTKCPRISTCGQATEYLVELRGHTALKPDQSGSQHHNCTLAEPGWPGQETGGVCSLTPEETAEWMFQSTKDAHSNPWSREHHQKCAGYKQRSCSVARLLPSGGDHLHQALHYSPKPQKKRQGNAVEMVSDPPRLQKDKAACTGQQLGDGRNLNAAGGG